jgi:4-amino-4-deoxy-L-arabinose transferase-like glycosyltransferase
MPLFQDSLVIAALVSAALAIVFLLATLGALKKKKRVTTALHVVTALLLFCLFALFGTISIATRGYLALTAETLAAVVEIEPVDKQRFIARFRMPDGDEKAFVLAGDQLYVDAHILKWKPMANVLGLHTLYELDRVSGRYARLEEETSLERTLYSLSREKSVDLFDLRHRFASLEFLVDAEYGSATFIKTDKPQTLKLLVSTTGLMIRKDSTGRLPHEP